MPQTNEPNLGRIVFKMCDRTKQVKKFTDFFISNLESQPGGIPQFYIVHGEDGECHESLVNRLTSTKIKEGAKTKWNLQDIIIHDNTRVAWSYEGDDKEQQEELKSKLFEGFKTNYVGDLSTSTLDNLQALSKNHLVIIQHNIHGTRWNRSTNKLMRWYLSYWLDRGDYHYKRQYLIFFNIMYPESQRKSWLAALWGKQPKKDQIERELKELAKMPPAGCPCLMFDELLPLKQEDVKDWFSTHNIYDSDKKRRDLIIKLFTTDNGQLAEQKRMSEIEDELKDIHTEFTKERV